MPDPTCTSSPPATCWEAKQEHGDLRQSGGGGEVFVHRDEGEYSRIRKGDAVRRS